MAPLVLTLATAAPSFAQLPLNAHLELRVRGAFDRANPQTRLTYFPPPADTALVRLVVVSLRDSLTRRFEEGGFKQVGVRLVGDATDSLAQADVSYRLDLRLSISGNAILLMNLTLVGASNEWSVDPSPDRFSKTAEWELVRDTTAEGARARSVLAATLAQAASGPVFRAVTEATFKLRVRVESVADSAMDPRDARFAGFFVRAVEDEMAKSAAIFVMTGASLARPDSVAPQVLGPNYVVQVGHGFLGGRIHLDVRVLKVGREARLLTSRSAVLDTLNAERVSREVSDVVREVRYTMESDFSRETKALAIVVVTASETFVLRRPSAREVATARAMMRALSQKVRRRTAAPASGKIETLTDFQAAARYAQVPASAPEMLAALDANYLLLVTYQDLGARLGLSADLYSTDLERIAAGLALYSERIAVARTEDALAAIVDSLCQRVGPASCAPDSSRSRDFTLPLRRRAISLLIGTPLFHHSDALFLGHAGGFYLELGYQVGRDVVPLGAGGRWDVALGLTLGLESQSMVGPLLSYQGPASLFALANLTTSLTPWQYSSTTWNLAVGVSGGMQTLRWSLNPGDIDYLGTEPYRYTAFSLVFGPVAQFEVPLAFLGGGSISIVGRWLPVSSGTVTRFATLPLARYADTGGPTGKLGGAYVMAGLGFRF